jgi:hypothetical protein
LANGENTSATLTGWDSDTNLDYSPSTKTYSITMNMKVGEFKFRLDDGWSTNFGDDGNNLTLDPMGLIFQLQLQDLTK